MSKWIQPRGGNNLVLDSEDKSFFISYNPKVGDAPEMDTLTELANLLGALIDMPELKNREEETALVKRSPGKPNTFSILNGDFRKQYEQLLPQGYEACLKFYEQHKEEYGSGWSTQTDD